MLGLDWWSTILKHPHMWKFENARLTGVHSLLVVGCLCQGYKILGSGGLAASLFWLKESLFQILTLSWWQNSGQQTWHIHYMSTTVGRPVWRTVDVLVEKLCILILGRSFSTRSHSPASMAVASMPTGLLARTLAWISSTLERTRCWRQCRKLFFDKLCKRGWFRFVIAIACFDEPRSILTQPIYAYHPPSQPNSQLNWPPGWC